MSPRNSPKRALLGSQASASVKRRDERTPLLDSVAISESLVNNRIGELQTGVSWGVAAFLLVNTALGAGMLNYPYAYNQVGGVLAASLMQIVLLVFITSTMFILVYCADFNHDDNYHDVLLSMCGKRAQQISAISILLTCYGINITFLVIIGDQYDRIFESLLPELSDECWFLNRKFTIFATAVLFIWPMCYAQRLDFLRHASILGMFAMLYVAFLTVYEHYKLDDITKAAMANRVTKEAILANSTNNLSYNRAATKIVQWFEPLAIIPVLCFAYQTHEVIVPVYACMKQRFMSHFMKASISGLIILFLLYNLVGAYGYLTFGANVGPDIMSLYDAKDPVVVVGIVALVIKFITTYPPLMFCGRGALDGLYGEFRKLSTEEFKSGESTRRIVITTLWFFSTVAFAAFASDISVTLQLLGSMAAINVFVFPGMCLISLTRRLRRARLSLLLDENYDYNCAYQSTNHLQRAKDYYLISGSGYFGAIKRNPISRVDSLPKPQSTGNPANSCLNNSVNSGANSRHQFTATFASLIEFEHKTTSLDKYGENSKGNRRVNGYNATAIQTRSAKRQEEFERLLTNGSGASEILDDQGGSFGRTVNDSYNDYSDCDDRNQATHIATSVTPLPYNGLTMSTAGINAQHRGSGVTAADTEFDVSSYNNKDPSFDRSINRNHHRHCLQNSWKNKSTTGSILDRLGSSIAPSTVAQIGISRCAAFGLFSFATLLMIFGAFIFVLELVTVSGFIW